MNNFDYPDLDRVMQVKRMLVLFFGHLYEIWIAAIAAAAALIYKPKRTKDEQKCETQEWAKKDTKKGDSSGDSWIFQGQEQHIHIQNIHIITLIMMQQLFYAKPECIRL